MIIILIHADMFRIKLCTQWCFISWNNDRDRKGECFFYDPSYFMLLTRGYSANVVISGSAHLGPRSQREFDRELTPIRPRLARLTAVPSCHLLCGLLTFTTSFTIAHTFRMSQTSTIIFLVSRAGLSRGHLPPVSSGYRVVLPHCTWQIDLDLKAQGRWNPPVRRTQWRPQIWPNRECVDDRERCIERRLTQTKLQLKGTIKLAWRKLGNDKALCRRLFEWIPTVEFTLWSGAKVHRSAEDCADWIAARKTKYVRRKKSLIDTIPVIVSKTKHASVYTI